MFTWISRLSVILAALFLAGCDEATGLPFATEPGAASDGNGGRARTAMVKLAGGEILLAAPDGYCIDRRSVRFGRKAGFAVMARCDTLGVRGFFGAYDLAIITIATQPALDSAALPTPAQVAGSAGSAGPLRVLAKSSRNGLSLVRLGGGTPPVDGVSDVYWRGAFVVNGHLVGVSLYAPENSPVLRDEGAVLLREMAYRTRQASQRIKTEKTATGLHSND